MRLQRTDRGAVAVEFAIVVPIFLILLLAVIDGGRLLYVRIALLNSASQGARAAALALPAGSVIGVAQGAAPGAASMSGSGAGSVAVAINASCPTPPDPTSTAMSSVTTSLPFSFFAPFPDQNLSATSEWLCLPTS